ncbi:MAG: helix-turn-helix domain-containing protein [Ruminococcus sp.]|nr:helix-turn-helix domain-containing protein [Ruminococcus sp.]
MIYGDKLKEIRENLELKQTDLSKILQATKEVYGNYEREFQIMPLKHLNTICNYFNISLDYAFKFTDILNYENSTDNIDVQLVGERLKEFRKENRITIAKLAEILNLGNGTIAGYEKGRYLISTAALYDICKKYNISADYLLGKVDNPKYLNNKYI